MGNDIQKCECPPGSPTYEDDEGMLICSSCGGWVNPVPTYLEWQVLSFVNFALLVNNFLYNYDKEHSKICERLFWWLG